MHSLHQLKKWQRDDEKLASIKRRVECQDNELHFYKTRDLANKYELRVDTWLRDANEKHPAPVGKVKSIHSHSFRDRNPKLELDNARISPNRYTLEKKRIEDTIASRMLTWDPYQGPRGGVFRTRDRSKELHPEYRIKDISDKGRIADFLKSIPSMQQRPWSQLDNPKFYKIRDIKKGSWAAGDFDMRTASRWQYPHSFLSIAEPFAPPFGSRVDDFRPRTTAMELSGDFYANTPGYFPDAIPGKWMQDPNIPLAGSPLARSTALLQAVTPGTKVQAGRVVVPKSYWKASAQIQVEKKEAVDRYHTILERTWEEHRERAATATRLISMHYDLNGDTIREDRASATAFGKSLPAETDNFDKSLVSQSMSQHGSFQDNASQRSMDL